MVLGNGIDSRRLRPYCCSMIHTLGADVEEADFVCGEGVGGCFAEVGD